MQPNFNDLRDGNVDQFYTRVRHNGAVWVFHHIPKTAGSSITEELDTLLPPYRNIFAEMQPGETESRDTLLRRATERFLEDHAKQQFRAASGHLRLPHVRQISEAVPNSRFFTFLRDPVARVISDYRYARTPKHPVYQEFIERYPDIETYIEDPSVADKMWKFMAGAKPEADEAFIEKTFRRYIFVGCVEDLASDFAFVTALFGYPKRLAARANTTQTTESNKVEVSDDLKAKIEAKNARDVALYRAARAITSAKRAEMDAFIESRRALYG